MIFVEKLTFPVSGLNSNEKLINKFPLQNSLSPLK